MTSPILRLTTRLMVVPLLALALYLLWRGHNAPGGGFIAALVASVALALRGLTDPPDRTLNFPPAASLLGIGLLLALSAVVGPLFVGAPLMTSFDTHIYPFGLDIHLTTSLVFDSGVAFIVVGLLRGMIDALERPESAGTGVDDTRHGPFGAFGVPDEGTEADEAPEPAEPASYDDIDAEGDDADGDDTGAGVDRPGADGREVRP